MSEKRPSIFQKIKDATEVSLEAYMAKARSQIAEQEDEALYRKSVSRDMNYQTSSQGYLDRAGRISFSHLRQMALKDTIVAAIIQTRQNQVAAFSKPVKEGNQMGFRIKRRYEEKRLREITEELFGPQDDAKAKIAKKTEAKASEAEPSAEPEENSAEAQQVLGKARPPQKAAPSEDDDLLEENDPMSQFMVPEEAEEPEGEDPALDMEDVEGEDDASPGELSDREKMRMAKEEMRLRDREKIEALTLFVENCGYIEDRPFDSLKWDFESWLRATTRDSLTYDLIATETVCDQKESPNYFVPVDSSTIRFVTPEFGQYKNQDLASGYDILYPEKELEALRDDMDAFKLDPEKAANDDYKYAQVVRGRIERAFIPEELSVGMRNPTTDLYANGYSISELELLVGAVSSHIFTENYNHSYYTQGFSAKGILHIKAPINRRKLETLRTQWKAMVSGNRNSFQTPIMAGMDEVQWIPLTQNHSDMEFSNWMNYLIKIICGIYQIDPAEIGFGMREEGGSGGGGLGGSNTEEKLEFSKDKGLKPLMRFLENFLNKNVLSRIDDDFMLEFCGLHDEDSKTAVERQEKEVKFKKSVNEIREEDGLPPIEGADDLLLDPTYFQWFTQFHPEGQKLAQQNNLMQAASQPPMPVDEDGNPVAQEDDGGGQMPPQFGKSLRKSRVRMRRSGSRRPIVIKYFVSED